MSDDEPLGGTGGMADRRPVATPEPRRVRLHQAPRLGLEAARANHGASTGRRLPDGRRLPRRRRAAAICPSPLRLYTLTVISIVTIAGFPSWVLHTGDDWAVVSAKSLSRRRRYWPQGRQIAVAGALDIALFLVVVVGALVDQLVVVLVVLAAAAAPLAWYAVASGREAFACRRLGEAERVAIRTAPGPVYYVAGLAGGGRFAGRQLVGALLRRADAGAVTLIARTEDGVLARYFRLAGFETIMTAAAAWGTVALLVRAPQPVLASSVWHDDSADSGGAGSK